MSRCFPYPPPGYTLNSTAEASNNNEALIESIKLQKEREKTKAERKKVRKEKKREKEEKKRDKKAKKESSNLGFDKAAYESKGNDYLFKCSENEAEQRSNLTEEHGQAVCSQNSSCSSDSTQNSNKRKRPDSPLHSGIQAHGSIIRIRLSKKGRQGETSTSQEKSLAVPAQQRTEVTRRVDTLLKTTNNQRYPCASVAEPIPAGRVDTLLKTTNNQRYPCAPVAEPIPAGRVDTLLKTTNNQRYTCAPVAKPIPSTSGCADERFDKSATASCSNVRENSIESQYKNLIENWLPPSLQCNPNDFGDEDWLFQRKPKQTRVEEKSVVSSDTTCGSSVLWPRAQYLHDVELYALPYTVPF